MREHAKIIASFSTPAIVPFMKAFQLRWGAIIALVALAVTMLGCAEMNEGDSNVPDRINRGLQGGGHLGSSPSGMFEPR
jgi:hypothetical protein